MAWEQLNRIWRGDTLFFNETGPISIQELRSRPEIGYVTRERNIYAREMIIRQEKEVYGKDGEFAILQEYDVYADEPHPDLTCFPLSVYGMAMVNDYKAFHNF